MPTLVQPVLRVDDEVDRGRDIGPAVGAVAEMHRQLGEVGILAGEHDLLRGCFGTHDLEDLRLALQAALDFANQRARLDTESACEPGAAAGDVRDQLLPLRSDRAEHHRTRVAFEDGRHVCEIERHRMRLDLAGAFQACNE